MAELVTSKVDSEISNDFDHILINLDESKLIKNNILKILNDSLIYVIKYKNFYLDVKIEGKFKYHIDNLQRLLKNLLKVGNYFDNYMNFAIWPDYNNQVDVMNYNRIFSYFDVTRSMQGCVSSTITKSVVIELNTLIDFKKKIVDYIMSNVKCIGDKDISSFKLDFDSSSINEMFNDEFDLITTLLFENIIRTILGNIEVMKNNDSEINELEKSKPKTNSSIHF